MRYYAFGGKRNFREAIKKGGRIVKTEFDRSVQSLNHTSRFTNDGVNPPLKRAGAEAPRLEGPDKRRS
jgi:hypothetical protein